RPGGVRERDVHGHVGVRRLLGADRDRRLRVPAQEGRAAQHRTGGPFGDNGRMSRPGLRERKKQKTRSAIQREAMRLFQEQGYDATTVEQIAEAAEISQSTFFRYFPTKEDVILLDDYDPLLIRMIAERPAEEPPVTAVRNAIVEAMRTALTEEEEQ